MIEIEYKINKRLIFNKYKVNYWDLGGSKT